MQLFTHCCCRLYGKGSWSIFVILDKGMALDHAGMLRIFLLVVLMVLMHTIQTSSVPQTSIPQLTTAVSITSDSLLCCRDMPQLGSVGEAQVSDSTD